MEISWKIDVLTDSSERSERFVHCVTENVADPVSRYQIEMLSHMGFRRNRKLKRFRQHFSERQPGQPRSPVFSVLFLDDYWEDSAGNEVNKAVAWEKLFKVPQGSLHLVSTDTHWIKLQVGLANGVAPFGEVAPKIYPEQQFVLNHFSLDTLQLGQSRFMTCPSPFKLSGPVNQPLQLQTIGLEHVGHFISVFRRVFADKEPASYKKLCNAVQILVPGTIFADWLIGERGDLNKYLSDKAVSWLVQKKAVSFNRDQLINNFMYGQFLHQPDQKKEATHAQWAKEIGGSQLLEAVFYETAMTVAGKLNNWGQWIRNFCRFANISLDENSAGTAISSPHPVDDRPERFLSVEQLKSFEDYAAELGVCLRDNDDPTVRASASTYVERAKNYLRDVL